MLFDEGCDKGRITFMSCIEPKSKSKWEKWSSLGVPWALCGGGCPWWDMAAAGLGHEAHAQLIIASGGCSGPPSAVAGLFSRARWSVSRPAAATSTVVAPQCAPEQVVQATIDGGVDT